MTDSPKFDSIQTVVRLSSRYLGVFMACMAFIILVACVLSEYGPRFRFQPVTGVCIVVIFCLVAASGLVWLARWVKRMKKKITFSFNDQLSIQIFDANPERVIEDYQIPYTDIKSFDLSYRGGFCNFKIIRFSGKPLKLVLEAYENWGEVTAYKIALEIVAHVKQINPAIA